MPTWIVHYQLPEMKKNYTLKLIDGKFTPSEASRVLMDLVSSKMHYHEMENFSSRERFNKDAPHSARRLKALKKLKEQLQKIFNAAAKNKMELIINSDIEIVIIEK